LEQQLSQLKKVPVSAKFGGATGNFNAHKVTYPAIDWRKFGNDFLSEKLGLEREQWTTQISNYDNLAAQFDALKRINTILIDFCRDIWSYVSMEYFKQKIKAGEVGSSAMPHKVNPIDFENAEGNLGMAAQFDALKWINTVLIDCCRDVWTYVSMEYFKQKIKAGEVGSSAMPHKVNPIDFENAEGNLAIANASLEFLAGKLPISRLQRDLTDSTVLRNVGVPFAHTLIATQSILKGLNKLLLNETAIYRDLDNTWAVVAEGIQTILRREAYPSPYEALKALTRTNEEINERSIREFIDTLNVDQSVKEELKRITPRNYTGV
jgi:adenylosuccinate lyase